MPDPSITPGPTARDAVILASTGDGFELRAAPSVDQLASTTPTPAFAPGQGPAWAIGDFWAPEIRQVGDHYTLYYTARNSDGWLAIGAATAATPEGPYTDSGKPLITAPGTGVIDPTFFRDDNGRTYLFWKVDGNAVDKPSVIMGSELAADGTSLIGPRVPLLQNDQAWESKVVEAPSVVKHNGSYYLFFSGNYYGGAGYATGVARSASPLGPYSKDPANPILHRNDRWSGTGGGTAETLGGKDVLVYNAIKSPGEAPLVRQPFIAPIKWNQGWPSVSGPGP